VLGGLGHDTVNGGYGNDVLYGQTGGDAFMFDAKLGTARTDRKVNFDKVADFNVKSDSFWLDNAVFKKLGGKGSEDHPAKLKKAFFTIGDHAQDKNDYLIYDSKTGVLSYDADGSGAKAAVEFAKLKKDLKLSYHDFFVI
jgi:Ca2+-binding RTX toxin-like protein